MGACDFSASVELLIAIGLIGCSFFWLIMCSIVYFQCLFPYWEHFDEFHIILWLVEFSISATVT